MKFGVLHIASLAAVAAWSVLIFARGDFWRAVVDDEDARAPSAATKPPSVHAVVPARNEAEVVGETLPSLLAQAYAGSFDVTLVDDHSDDGTGDVARDLAAPAQRRGVHVIDAEPLPSGWTGKLWALECGVRAVRASGSTPVYWLFTDADIRHDETTVARSVARALDERRDLVSYMVLLRATSGWERLLIPAFVFFFMKLYPFAWSNDDRRATAAAAGGCVLISDAALRRIGGLASLRDALIDDCTLAARVKGSGGRIWLGLTTRIESVRGYDTLGAIWRMVARSAFTQLDRSWLNVAGTVAGMTLLYVVPPLAAVTGVIRRDGLLAFSGAVTWTAIGAAYSATLRLYGETAISGAALPFAAALYTLMTVDSARRSLVGEHGAWKGRSYGA